MNQIESATRQQGSGQQIGIRRRTYATRIVCGCISYGHCVTADEASLRHGRDASGNLKPCPNPLRVEVIGDLNEMTDRVRAAGCETFDEFRSKHPIQSWLFQLQQRAKIKLDELRSERALSPGV